MGIVIVTSNNNINGADIDEGAENVSSYTVNE